VIRLITSFRELFTISGIKNRRIIDQMKGKAIISCPLVPNLNVCHPSCNWWDGVKCTYPMSLRGKATHKVKVAPGKFRKVSFLEIGDIRKDVDTLAG
jgi:hypothetical protein